eukprot:6951899-Prymnesium_polylepis.1
MCIRDSVCPKQEGKKGTERARNDGRAQGQGGRRREAQGELGIPIAGKKGGRSRLHRIHTNTRSTTRALTRTPSPVNQTHDPGSIGRQCQQAGVQITNSGGTMPLVGSDVEWREATRRAAVGRRAEDQQQRERLEVALARRCRHTHTHTIDTPSDADTPPLSWLRAPQTQGCGLIRGRGRPRSKRRSCQETVVRVPEERYSGCGRQKDHGASRGGALPLYTAVSPTADVASRSAW